MTTRGTTLDTGNRFSSESRERFDDGWESFAEEPDPRTEFLDDASRTAFATNSSPDIPFSHSINPYRGCEHGCAYCLAGDTPILMANGSWKPLAEIRVGDAIYGTVRQGFYRRYTKTTVLAHWSTRKQAYRITLGDGTQIVSSGDHRFLTERGWKYVTGAEHGAARRPHLTGRNKLMGFGAVGPAPIANVEFRRGYLAGIIHGDGHLAIHRYQRVGRKHGDQWQFRLALKDDEALDRAGSYLDDVGIQTKRFMFQKASAKCMAMAAIRTHSRAQVESIQALVAKPSAPSREWFRGFLSGIFDAEGSYSGGVLRMSNTDPGIIASIQEGLVAMEFNFVRDVVRPGVNHPVQTIRLTGGLHEHLRFFDITRPAIQRKCDITNTAVKSTANLKVMEITPLGYEMEMFDITTGTEDFIANGVIAHNCYARPTHEYLGYNAGIDFETRIMVKRDAAMLARKEMMKKSWTPTVVSISGVTDPYQPAEKRFGITRQILETMLEFRNPVTIVTKNALVLRDLDLLAELAKHNCAAVFISITTLDRDLARRLEPRTSTPERRLEAVRRLSEAGVPTGVMMAPLIPGLTDEEVPSLLKAAADAGARQAFHVLVRLPLAVRPIFIDWLEREEPARAAKVLHALEEMREGKLNIAEFGDRMKGKGARADAIASLFKLTAKRLGLNQRELDLTTANFRRPAAGGQLEMF